MATGHPLPLQKPPGYRNPTLPIQRPPQPPYSKYPPLSFPNKKKPRHSCCCIFCYTSCISILIIIFLLICMGIFLFIWFEPHPPEANLKSLHFTKFDVAFNQHESTLNAESTIHIDIKNPNRNLIMEHDNVRIYVYASKMDADLGEQTVPGFTQGLNNVTTLKFSTVVQKAVIDSETAKKLKNGFENKNLVVNAELRTRIGLKGSGWSSGMLPVKVVCERLRVGRSEASIITPKCHIIVFNLLFIS